MRRKVLLERPAGLPVKELSNFFTVASLEQKVDPGVEIVAVASRRRR
jgi:hypothetical protein